MNAFRKIGLALLCAIACTSLAAPADAFQRPDRTSPFCSYRSYKHLLPRLVPGRAIEDVRVFPGRVDEAQRRAISRDLDLGVGRSEFGRHMLYVPVDSQGEALGLLRIHSEPGDHGLVFLAIFLDHELQVLDFAVIQYRGRAKAWIEENRDLRRRMKGADGKTLRSWLDGEGRALSAAGIQALGLEKSAAGERRLVVHLVRIAAKAIGTTEVAWGARMRALGYIAPSSRAEAEAEPRHEEG